MLSGEMAMFIFSFKASKIKILLSVVLCALIATVAIILMPDTEHTVTVNGTQYDKKISFDKIKTTEDMVTFAENLGYSVDSVPAESVTVKLPSTFDAVLEEYNEIQKSQGFNLAKYKNKEVNRSTFRVAALPDNQSMPAEDVLLSLIVYKDKIVGGDLYFTGSNPEVKAFLK